MKRSTFLKTLIATPAAIAAASQAYGKASKIGNCICVNNVWVPIIGSKDLSPGIYRVTIQPTDELRPTTVYEAWQGGDKLIFYKHSMRIECFIINMVINAHERDEPKSPIDIILDLAIWVKPVSCMCKGGLSNSPVCKENPGHLRDPRLLPNHDPSKPIFRWDEPEEVRAKKLNDFIKEMKG